MACILALAEVALRDPETPGASDLGGLVGVVLRDLRIADGSESRGDAMDD